jgi:hypothetical protein
MRTLQIQIVTMQRRLARLRPCRRWPSLPQTVVVAAVFAAPSSAVDGDGIEIVAVAAAPALLLAMMPPSMRSEREQP